MNTERISNYLFSDSIFFLLFYFNTVNNTAWNFNVIWERTARNSTNLTNSTYKEKERGRLLVSLCTIEKSINSIQLWTNALTMSWLRTSPLRQSFTRTSRSRSIDATNTECDPKACYDSFCKHWQQIYEIILRAEVRNSFLYFFWMNFKLRWIYQFQLFILYSVADFKWNEPWWRTWCRQSFGSYGHIIAVRTAQLQ